jgi:glycosyltransferase involved in cell wall biosynthesis
MKTLVIIPAHNEAKTISNLISQILALNLDIVIIDDGSTDATALIAEQLRVPVIRNPQNLGKGASLIRGFEYFLKNDYDACIIMDADGQHLPEDIPNFVETAMKNESAGIIIGNRMADLKNMPFIRILTNKFMSWLLSGISGQKVYDSQCGFRLIRREALEQLSLKTSKFEIESEIIIEAGRSGVKIESIPIQTIYRKERSHINPFIDTFRFFKFILKKILKKP